MNYKIINTGSDGNCILINDDILLDCGVSFKKLEPYYKKIKIVFISHQHKDHLLPSTIKKLAFERPTLRFCVRRVPSRQAIRMWRQQKEHRCIKITHEVGL